MLRRILAFFLFASLWIGFGAQASADHPVSADTMPAAQTAPIAANNAYSPVAYTKGDTPTNQEPDKEIASGEFGLDSPSLTESSKDKYAYKILFLGRPCPGPVKPPFYPPGCK